MKHKLVLSGILGVMLIFVMFLFLGCPTDDSSDDNGGSIWDNEDDDKNGDNTGNGNDDKNGDNNNGNNRDDSDNRGFLEILYGESSGDSSTEEGVYVGLISFAGDASVICDPVLLDASGYNTLKSKITNDYRRASKGGTTMFLAVHKALAELKKNESTYPAKLDTVSIITFTDGLDNQSLAILTDPLNESGSNYQLENKTYNVDDPESEGAYMNYIKGEIDGRKIAGHSIKAYAVGVQGRDVEDTTAFEISLPKVASNGNDESNTPYFTKLTDFDDLRGTFQSIAKGLDVTHTSIDIVMTTIQSPTGTTYRWTFDGVDNASSVGSSTKYIEATMTSSSGTRSLTNITYAGGISTAQGNGPLTGVATPPSDDGEIQMNFRFTSVTGYDPDTDAKPKQWVKRYGSTTWGSESEIDSTGNAERSVEHKTAYIYLVLDASTSLSDAHIASIKSAITSGSSSGNNSGNNQAPSAPTNVTASTQSSSSIRVSWSSVSGASYYEVYRGNELRGEATTTSYTDTGLSSNTTYSYRVKAVNNSGSSDFSPSASATTYSSSSGNNAPSTPTGVTANTLSSSSIEVYWDSVPGAEYYEIYRSGGSYGEVSWDIYDGTYLYDSELSSNTTYSYRVKAVNSSGSSDFSPSASATTYSSSSGENTPSAPTGVSASAQSSSSISVSWNTVSGAIYYYVYRSSRANGTYSPIGFSYSPSYTDTEVSANTTYYYKVIAVNSAGVESDFSSYASATTQSSGGLGISDITYSSVSGGTWTLQSDGSRKSPTIYDGDVTKARVSFTSGSYNTSITIQLTVSSEDGYDYAFISELDNASASYDSGYYSDSVISGQNTVTVTIPVSSPGRHFIDIGYRKDGSVSSGSDCAWFTVIHSQ